MDVFCVLIVVMVMQLSELTRMVNLKSVNFLRVYSISITLILNTVRAWWLSVVWVSILVLGP